MEDLDKRGLGRLAPEELTSIQPAALAAWQQDAIIAQAAQHLLAAAEGGETGEDQLDGALHLLVRVFNDPAILQTDQAGGQILPIGDLPYKNGRIVR